MASNILIIGDSIVNGQNLPGLGGFRTLLYRQLEGAGVEFDFVGGVTSGQAASLPGRACEGHDGEHLPYFSSNIAAWCESYSPDVVVILAGMAQIAAGDVATAVDDYQTLVSTTYTAAPNAAILCCTVPGIGAGSYSAYAPDIETLNTGIAAAVTAAQAAGKRVSICNSNAAYYNPSTYTDDGVHPTAAGYALLADTIFKSLIKLVPPTRSATIVGSAATSRSARNR